MKRPLVTLQRLLPVEYMKRLSNLFMKHLRSLRAIESKYICLLTRVLRVVALPLQQNEWFFMTATVYRFQIVNKKKIRGNQLLFGATKLF